jgi:hypothetical protein
MLFRLEPTPWYRGEKPLGGNYRWIEVLAVLPSSMDRDDGEGRERAPTIRNLFLCRTDAGLQRIDERQVWDALRAGQYREARRSRNVARQRGR